VMVIGIQIHRPKAVIIIVRGNPFDSTLRLEFCPLGLSFEPIIVIDEDAA